MAWFMRHQIHVIFHNFGHVETLKMSKVRLYNQASDSIEGEGVSKSIITTSYFLLGSKIFCLSNLFG